MFMKKLLPMILPSLLIFALIGIDHFMGGEDSMKLIVYIYLIFPFIFIVQGIACSKSRNSMLIGFLLSSIAVMLPISLWYKVGSMIIPVIIYLILGVIAFILSKRKNKKN